MPRPLWAVLLVTACAVLVFALAPTTERTDACAFDPRRPYTFEADQGRGLYNLALDAASVNAIFPTDPFFQLPPIERGPRGARVDGQPYIPATLLKAIAWVESTMTMASRSVRFDSIGEGLVSFDCGHGIMQVTTGMTIPLGTDGEPSDRQVNIATHFAYNVARGAQILAEKWNAAPEQRAVVGADTGADPAIIENWYFATWAYNGFTGPGSNQSNHPLDPSFGAWPRPEYRCDGTQSRNRYPYQELVWGCMAHPDTRNSQLVWQPVAASLPDLTQAAYFIPMSLANWSFPYSAMDIPTPQPAHLTQPPQLPPDARTRLLGSPAFSAESQRVSVYLNDPTRPASATVTIANSGTGVLTWVARTQDNFLVLTPPAGVAVGSDLTCTGSGCPRGALTITVNPTLLPASRARGTVTLTSTNGGAGIATIQVDIIADFATGAPGTSRAP